MIEYRLRRSPRGNLRITVHPDRSVEITAPHDASKSRIEEAVRSRAAWIVKQRDWLERNYPQHVRGFVNGETFLYLGRQYQLRIVKQQRGKGRVRLVGREFRVEIGKTALKHDPKKGVRELMVAWYRCHALPNIAKMAQQLAPKLGVQYSDIRLLDMPTRWGSGGNNGRLRFNWRIVMAPKKLIEYVVAHELAHTCHSNHSAAFWKTVGRVIPDWPERRDQLATRGPVFTI